MSYNTSKMIWKSKSQKIKSSSFVLNELDYQESNSPTKIKKKCKGNENDCKEIMNKVELLKNEGSDLVAEDKYEEAAKRLTEAKNLLPDDETIYEMLSQIYMLTRKDFQAIKYAEKVVELKRIWWIGWQTLGRAQMNFGDVNMAIKSFSRAIHLNPSEKELWAEDLEWAITIKEKELQNEDG